ncbi:MAG TPA: hypothetical protein VER55_16950, partial [Ardenticatenaceae bacterium]|nr:hypothetical protein [Ardenticatenaceae bacterium]
GRPHNVCRTGRFVYARKQALHLRGRSSAALTLLAVAALAAGMVFQSAILVFVVLAEVLLIAGFILLIREYPQSSRSKSILAFVMAFIAAAGIAYLLLSFGSN